jgi:hypothetical protein
MKPGAIIGLRPTMVKFESKSRHLEVCTFAMPLVFSLNRQIIMALRTLGISDTVFLDIYHSIVKRLDAIRDGGQEALDVRRPSPLLLFASSHSSLFSHLSFGFSVRSPPPLFSHLLLLSFASQSPCQILRFLAVKRQTLSTL